MKKTRNTGPGWSTREAANRCEIPIQRFQRAMDMGEVEFFEFGGKRRILDKEIARIRTLHGLSATPDLPDDVAAFRHKRKVAS